MSKSNEKNGVKRPGEGTKTGKVWEIADKLREKHGKELKRADVLAEGQKKGLSIGTLATQFQNWRIFNGLAPQIVRSAKPKAAKKPAKAPTKAAAKKASQAKAVKVAKGAPKAPKAPKPPKAPAAPAEATA